MAVDISAAAQPGTQTYYPTADFVPGGVANGLYKTTTLLMRKVMAKKNHRGQTLATWRVKRHFRVMGRHWVSRLFLMGIAGDKYVLRGFF